MANVALITPVEITVVCEKCSDFDYETDQQNTIKMEVAGPLVASPDNLVQTQAYICHVCYYTVTVTMTIKKPS